MQFSDQMSSIFNLVDTILKKRCTDFINQLNFVVVHEIIVKDYDAIVNVM